MKGFVLPFDFDNDLIETARSSGGRPVTRIYPFEFKAVVAGRGSDLDKEVHMARVRQDEIPVFRRKGGGCSVFLDPGTLVVSTAFTARGFGGIQTLFDQCSQWLIQGFQTIGLAGIYQDGISDLVVADLKIGGSCFYRAKDLAYYSAAILVTPDLDLMGYYLAHPPREPDYRRGRPHRDFVSAIDRFCPGTTVEGLARDLTAALDRPVLTRAA